MREQVTIPSEPEDCSEKRAKAGISFDTDEYWTVEYLVDKLTQNLAAAKDEKYFNRAKLLLGSSSPTYLINMSDLEPRVIIELAQCNSLGLKHVTFQAVGRIVHNANLSKDKRYLGFQGSSKAPNLKVKFEA